MEMLRHLGIYIFEAFSREKNTPMNQEIVEKYLSNIIKLHQLTQSNKSLILEQ